MKNEVIVKKAGELAHQHDPEFLIDNLASYIRQETAMELPGSIRKSYIVFQDVPIRCSASCFRLRARESPGCMARAWSNASRALPYCC